MLTESLLLAIAGGLLGWLLAAWGVDLIAASFKEPLPFWLVIEADRRVFMFTVGLSLATGLAFGLVPALRAPARDYLVFFDFDKTDIRADSASILDRVMQAIGELGSSSVTLVGHADRAGPSDYNQGLSERRAAAVRNYLLGKGTTAGISPSGQGEEDPRVATPDGMQEQENRRVEIRID